MTPETLAQKIAAAEAAVGSHVRAFAEALSKNDWPAAEEAAANAILLQRAVARWRTIRL